MSDDTKAMLFSSALQIPGWAYLWHHDWRVMIAVAAILWGNNLDLARRIPRVRPTPSEGQTR